MPSVSPPAAIVTRWLAAYAALSLRRPWLLALASLCALFAAAPLAVLLYTDLRTDLRELLPKGAPASVALDTLERRVGGFSHMSVVVRTDDLAAGERFMDALANKLAPLEPTTIREVRYRTDLDRKYLEEHGALHLPEDELVDLNEAAKETARTGRPQDVGLDGELAELLKPDAKFPDGYFSGEGGHTVVMLLSPNDAAMEVGQNQRFYQAVDDAVRALDPASFHPSMRVGYGGDVPGMLEAQAHLVRDIGVSSVIVLLAVAAVVALFYRGPRSLVLLGAPVLVGSSVTLAAAFIAIGYLNPNTAFLGTILVGNGVNPGIILLARYLDERRGGAKVEAALPEALGGTWRATMVASGAAAASYGCLAFTGFRGFSHFAFIGGVGMVLTWLATYLVMPPLLVLFERSRPLVSSRPSSLALGPAFARLVTRWPLVPVAVSAALTLGAGVFIVRFAKDPIEYDFSRMGSRQSAIDGVDYWATRVENVMQSYLTPTVILTDDAEHAAKVAEALREERERAGSKAPIHALDRVVTLAEVLPADQAKKLPLVREIVGRFDDRLVASFPAASRPLAERLRARTALREVTIDDLPPYVARLFREKDGRLGRLVLVYPTLEATSKNGKLQLALVKAIRETTARADPKAQVAGSVVLGADIVEAITRDGSLAAAISLAVVAILTALLVGEAKGSLFVVGALAAGIVWLGGVLGALDIKLNFINFAVLPITFGIGVDYAVNLYQRYRELGPGSARRALGSSGGAIALCSATTSIGYSALLFADNRALQSFGIMAVVGELTCLGAALVGLPALLCLCDGRRETSLLEAA